MIEGILCVDKPTGPTSHDVVSRIRRLADTRKVGHGGTLDPLASGLLVLAIGRATRLLEYVLGQPKEYQALVRLGQTSDTYDGEGELVDSGVVDVTEAQLATALARFRGDIRQTPPMFSAIKRQGKPLYELARQGIAVEREAREVTIYELELLSYAKPDITLRVRCSSGTYIRSLAHDLGQELDCGAYLAGLRRTGVGRLTLQVAAPLQTLTADTLAENMQAMDSVVAHLPRLDLTWDEAVSLSQGQRVDATEGVGVRQSVQDGKLLRAYDDRGEFVGIVSREEGKWRAKKIFYDSAPDGNDS